MRSTYWWQSNVETATEWTVQFKTAPGPGRRADRQVRHSHPYEVPEILVSHVGSGNPDYTAWVRNRPACDGVGEASRGHPPTRACQSPGKPGMVEGASWTWSAGGRCTFTATPKSE